MMAHPITYKIFLVLYDGTQIKFHYGTNIRGVHWVRDPSKSTHLDEIRRFGWVPNAMKAENETSKFLAII